MEINWDKKGSRGLFHFHGPGSPRSETHVVMFSVNEAYGSNLWNHWELQQLNMTGSSEHSGGLSASVRQDHSALTKRGR